MIVRKGKWVELEWVEIRIIRIDIYMKRWPPSSTALSWERDGSRINQG